MARVGDIPPSLLFSPHFRRCVKLRREEKREISLFAKTHSRKHMGFLSFFFFLIVSESEEEVPPTPTPCIPGKVRKGEGENIPSILASNDYKS